MGDGNGIGSHKGNVQKTKWKFLIELAIKRQTPPPLNGTNFHQCLFFLPRFFLLQLNITYMKLILHLASVKNLTFKSSYNWFKIDFCWLLRPPTAIFSHVHSHLNYYIHNLKLKLCVKRVLAVGGDCRWFLSNQLEKKR